MHKLVGLIITEMFSGEEARLTKEVNRIVQENKTSTKSTHSWFMFKGQVYQHSNDTYLKGGTAGGAYPTLTFSLNSLMEEYLQDRAQVDMDKAHIQQILFTMLYNCMTEQEVRDTLPACLLPLVPRLAAMPRIHGEHHMAPKDERFRRQFEKLLPKMEFYLACRLIF
jgi:hypothetical protein